MSPSGRQDLRLAIPAGAGLVAALATSSLPVGRSLSIAVVLTAGALCALCWAWNLDSARTSGAVDGRLHARSDRLRADRAALVVVALACGSAAACSAVQGAARRAVDVHPLSAALGSSTWVVGEVTGFARPAGTGMLSVPVRVEVVGGDDSSRSATLHTTMTADAGWACPPPGSRIRARVEVREGRPAGRAPLLWARGDPDTVDAAGPVGRVPAAVRRRFREVTATLPGSRAGPLLPSLVLGDETGVPEDTREEFRRAGLSHLSAVSGANVTVVVGTVVLVAGAVGAGRRGRSTAAGVALTLFVAVVGAEPSVVRAAATGVIGLAAVAGRRGSRPLAALSAVVLVVALLAPGVVTGLGFLLSVAATAALVVFARPSSRLLRARGWPGPVADAAAVCVVAQLAAAPVLVAADLPISPWALPANLAAAPAVPPVTVLGTAAAALAPLWPTGARILALPCVPAVCWLDLVAGAAAGAPGSPPRG